MTNAAKGAVVGGLVTAAISLGFFVEALVHNSLQLADRALIPLIGAVFWFVVAWLLH